MAARQRPALMGHFSTLAGPIQKLPRLRHHNVEFIDIISHDRLIYRYWTRVVAYGALLLVLGFGFMLFQPTHWIVVLQPTSATYIANWIMLICLVILQLFLIIGTYSATRSTLRAKDPIPVRPPKILRVALATTRAPGEPIDMVQTTLEAALQVHYRTGTVHVWLLDETNDRKLKMICKKLGVHYFSRAGVAEWNTEKLSQNMLDRIRTHLQRLLQKPEARAAYNAQLFDPYLAAKTKHGNFNAWRAYLAKKKITYDILAGVDTDQVPQPNFLERLLGYFRDENVAYVVGPQVYGNYGPGLRSLVSRWAESQASFFQSTIQRAGNASTSPMFVGTNYAVRMSVLDQIGGFQPCITEDMATGLAIHSKRNPATGKRWKSVYTPDVLAVGEGPNLWGPYFSQQWRWAAGTFDTWRRMVWRVFFRLSPKAMLHYFLMLTFYPMAAMTWLLGMVSSMLYLITGATAVLAPWSQFVSLYMMSMVMQLSLYFWNRRFNVSPHEPVGSYGISGIVLSTLAAPIYLSAFIGILLNKKVKFVVTSKGDTDNVDGWQAFRIHLQWAIVLLAGLVYGFAHNHHHPAMLIWVFGQLAVCLTPFILGMALAVPRRLRKQSLTKQLVTTGEPHNA